MPLFHICNTGSRSGIARYAADFQRLALAPQGYELVQPDAVDEAWIESQPANSVFHLQLGAMQFAERQALSRLLASRRPHVDVTLHDPPFLTFPYFPFESSWAMKLSRGFDWYLNSLGVQGRTLRRIRRVFVLSQKGEQSLIRYRLREIVRIPHIVAGEQIWPNGDASTNDILYFGFIGPTKGIDYALRLHAQIRSANPTLRMHVVGAPNGPAESAFLDFLKSTFREGVVYHGYVPENQLNSLFAQVRHVFLPFDQYRYFNPASGSVINALKRGRIVWSTPVNAVPELIVHGANGMLLTKELEQDAQQFIALSQDAASMDRIAAAALESAWAMSRYPYASHFQTIDPGPETHS